MAGFWAAEHVVENPYVIITAALIAAIPATIGAIATFRGRRESHADSAEIRTTVEWLRDQQIAFQEKGWHELPGWIGDAEHLTAYLVQMRDDIGAVKNITREEIQRVIDRLEQHEIREFSTKYLDEDEIRIIIQAELMAWHDRRDDC